jgi:hypothetical protein
MLHHRSYFQQNAIILFFLFKWHVFKINLALKFKYSPHSNFRHVHWPPFRSCSFKFLPPLALCIDCKRLVLRVLLATPFNWRPLHYWVPSLTPVRHSTGILIPVRHSTGILKALTLLSASLHLLFSSRGDQNQFYIANWFISLLFPGLANVAS